MLLENKNAVIYGAAGSVGGAVARTFAREGAKVHLAGRTLESLDEVAEEIRSAGGAAETAQVDAMDETAVDQHADAVAASAGGIDISFNLISVWGRPGDTACRDALRRFRAAGNDRRDNTVSDLEGGGTSHDRAGIGGDPLFRWLRGPVA